MAHTGSESMSRQDIRLAALRCSDQLYASEWRENIEYLFQSKEKKSQLVVFIPSSSAAEDSSPKAEVAEVAEVCLDTRDSPEEGGEEEEPFCEKPSKSEFDEGNLHDSSLCMSEMQENEKSKIVTMHLETVEDPYPKKPLSQPNVGDAGVFEAVMTRFGVFPRVKDILLYQGRRSLELEVGPPRLQSNLRPLEVEGRSGIGFEVAYCIRYIQLNGRSDAPSPWSLRQFVVHQRFDYGTKANTWIFVSPPAEIQDICTSFAPGADDPDGDYCHDYKALQIHQALVHWAVAQWRPYLAYLTKVVDEHTMKLIAVSHGQGGNAGLANFDVHQQLKQLEDEILDSALALKGTRSCVQDMSQFLDDVRGQAQNVHDPNLLPTAGVESEMQMQSEMDKELALLLERADSLRQKLRTSMSQLSSFLDLESSYTLQQLFREAQKESKKMEQIATRSMKDAAAVKLLTIIMMVYLPATIVLNFFSTEFITKTLLPDGTATTSVDHDWTIMLLISAPLTAGTIAIWWLWTEIQFGGLRWRERWVKLRAPPKGRSATTPPPSPC